MPGLVFSNATHEDLQTDHLNNRLFLHAGYNLSRYLVAKFQPRNWVVTTKYSEPIPKLGTNLLHSYLLQPPFTTSFLQPCC